MRKEPPDRKYPPGLEWALFRKLPLLMMAGFVVIGLLWVVFRVWPWRETDRALAALLLRLDFVLIGAAIFHLTVMLTLAIGCVVVLIMKGPRYSADSYFVSDAERPDRADRPR